MTITPMTAADLHTVLTSPGVDLIHAQFTAQGQRMTNVAIMPARVRMMTPCGAQDGDAETMLQALETDTEVGFELDLRTITRVEVEESGEVTPGRRTQNWWAYGPEGRAFYWVELPRA
jgi:hypothetical protein